MTIYAQSHGSPRGIARCIGEGALAVDNESRSPETTQEGNDLGKENGMPGCRR